MPLAVLYGQYSLCSVGFA